MPGPCAVHAAAGFVLFVFFEYGKRAGVEFRVFAARVKRRHATDGENAATMADFGQQQAEALEKRHVDGNGIAVGKDVARIVEIKIDEAGHVIPAAEIQTNDMVAKVVEKFLDLIRERMRFDQGHALDEITRPAAEKRKLLKKIAPEERFFRGFGLGN